MCSKTGFAGYFFIFMTSPMKAMKNNPAEKTSFIKYLFLDFSAYCKIIRLFYSLKYLLDLLLATYLLFPKSPFFFQRALKIACKEITKTPSLFANSLAFISLVANAHFSV
jgi:hypothetical protein